MLQGDLQLIRMLKMMVVVRVVAAAECGLSALPGPVLSVACAVYVLIFPLY